MTGAAQGLAILPWVSFCRALLGIAAGVLLTMGFSGSGDAAFLCLAVALAADLVDGSVPRRLGRSTQMAAFLDHAADTVIFAAVFIGLLAAGWMTVWQVLIVAAAEITVPYLRNMRGQAAEGLVIAWPERLRTLAYAAGQLTLVGAGSGVVVISGSAETVGWALAAAAALFWALTLLDCLRPRV
jgi:phosphatidylglycerophosphate synthase